MARLDRVIEAAAERAAEPGSVRYTEGQLYYEVSRTLRPTLGLDSGRARVGALLALAPVLVERRWRGALGTAGAFGGVAALYWLHRAPVTRRAPLERGAFAEALAGYVARRGRPEGLLGGEEAQRPLPLEGREPDLADYGLPRLLVCQSADVARMLVANQFHLEVACAVLSLEAATPLPDALFAMLARTPGAQVYLLHDASVAGLTAAQSFAADLELPHGVRAMAIGLRPQHAMRMQLFAQRGAPPQVGERIEVTTRERDWLAKGKWAEVEAVQPARLIRALRRVMLGTGGAPAKGARWPQRDAGFMTWPVG